PPVLLLGVEEGNRLLGRRDLAGDVEVGPPQELRIAGQRRRRHLFGGELLADDRVDVLRQLLGRELGAGGEEPGNGRGLLGGVVRLFRRGGLVALLWLLTLSRVGRQAGAGDGDEEDESAQNAHSGECLHGANLRRRGSGERR